MLFNSFEFLFSRKYPRREPGDEAIPWLGVECVINCADEISQTRPRSLQCALLYSVVCPILEKDFLQKYG